MYQALKTSLNDVADETGFSGVVRVSRGEELLYERASGLADRAHAVANMVETRFGIASGSKGFHCAGRYVSRERRDARTRHVGAERVGR